MTNGNRKKRAHLLLSRSFTEPSIFSHEPVLIFQDLCMFYYFVLFGYSLCHNRWVCCQNTTTKGCQVVQQARVLTLNRCHVCVLWRWSGQEARQHKIWSRRVVVTRWQPTQPVFWFLLGYQPTRLVGFRVCALSCWRLSLTVVEQKVSNSDTSRVHVDEKTTSNDLARQVDGKDVAKRKSEADRVN